MDEQWLKIGDLVRLTGLTSRTLRHYDQLGLLVPSGRSSGDYRLYGPADVQRLLAIQHLKSLGLSLQDIGSALDDESFDAGTALDDHIAVVEARIAAERELLIRLRRLRGAAATGWHEVVDVIALTERLRHRDAAIRFRTTLQSPRELPLEELLDLLRADPEPGVREVATWAIAQHGQAAVDAVVSQLDDPDPAVRLQMAHVASKLNDPAAVPGLVRLLEDTEPQVRAKAAFALGRLVRPDTIAPLVAVLAESDDMVADAVVGALGQFAAEAQPALVEALGSTSATVRERAADALGRQGLAASVPVLVAALGDPAASVRLTALLALTSINDDAARSAVAAARSHGDPHVSAVAARLS